MIIPCLPVIQKLGGVPLFGRRVTVPIAIVLSWYSSPDEDGMRKLKCRDLIRARWLSNWAIRRFYRHQEKASASRVVNVRPTGGELYGKGQVRELLKMINDELDGPK